MQSQLQGFDLLLNKNGYNKDKAPGDVKAFTKRITTLEE